ncbi:MAG: DinB family protein [Actinophytocola sp.]|uniref:DinB family protein n=1 Tax=Actinophytocola sp. TaxID=1872138 RepID=UPI003C78B2A7
MDANVPPVPDERSGLLGFLAQQRRVLKHAAYGLTEEQLRATPSASALSVGALLKHVAFTERGWIIRVTGGPEPSGEDSYNQQFDLSESDTLESLLAGLDAAGAETEAAIAEIDDLGRAVPVPDQPWFPKDLKAWSVRWVLLHLIEETARHAGHADIIRESIDGATGIELLAGAENWPPSPWLTPWHPQPPTT